MRWALAVVLGVGCGTDTEREMVPLAEPLGAMIDEHAKPFTGPIRLAELREGRVLAYDAREGRLVRVDFSTGIETPVSRRGEGPREYRSAVAVTSAVADSAWVFDLQRGRILVFSSDGEPVRGFDITGGRGSRGRISAPWLVAVDSSGGWYGRARAIFEPGGGGSFAESTAVVRMRSAGARHDTLAMLRAEGADRKTTAGLPRLTTFDAFDAFGVLRDGRVIVVRGATYTVEIVDGAGVSRVAGRVAHQRVLLTATEIREVADSINRMMGSLLAMSLARLPLTAGETRPLPEYMVPDPAPAHWPVLNSDVLPVDRRDRVWIAVRDSTLATAGQRYDLLDRDGRWIKAIRIPLGSVLVGFGESVVYVARRDDDDLLWLGRYPSPD